MNYDLDENTKEIQDGKIPAPFPLLEDIDNTVTNDFNQLSHASDATRAIMKIPMTPIQELEDRIKISDQNMQGLVIKAHNSSENAHHLRSRVEMAYKKIMDLRNSIHETVGVLEYFVNNDKHINIKKAVRSGKHNLGEINKVDFTDKLDEVTMILFDCQEMLNKLREVSQKQLT